MWRKNFLDISSLREARVVRFAADNITMYGMTRDDVNGSLLNSLDLFSLCLSQGVVPHWNTLLK